MKALYKCTKCGFEHEMAFPDSAKIWKETTCMNEETTCTERVRKSKTEQTDKEHKKMAKLQSGLNSLLKNPNSTAIEVELLRSKIRELRRGKGEIAGLFKKRDEMKAEPSTTYREMQNIEEKIQEAHGFPVKTSKLIKSWKE